MNRYDEDTSTAFEVKNPCERCGDQMPQDWIGVCSDCVRETEVERAEDMQWTAEFAACICWHGDFSGRSVCGVPCPVHAKTRSRL